MPGEHIALLIGTPDGRPPLVRLHSECLTGDVLGSLKCDCGPQLDAAHPRDRGERLGHPALSAAGRARHRPDQQAARLCAAGSGLRHGRRQYPARLRGRFAQFRGGGADARAARPAIGAIADQQPRKRWRDWRRPGSPSPNACRISCRPIRITSAIWRPSATGPGISFSLCSSPAERIEWRIPNVELPTQQPGNLFEIRRDIVHADRAQSLGVIGGAVAAAAEADDMGARGDGAGRADGRILQDHRARDVDAERGSGMKIEVRRGLAARDMFATAEELVAKGIADAEMVEMPRDPGGRAGRSDRPRQFGRQRRTRTRSRPPPDPALRASPARLRLCARRGNPRARAGRSTARLPPESPFPPAP